MALSFPLSVWGAVLVSQSHGAQIDRVRVDPSPGGGFIVLTQESGGTFDVWIETPREVESFLAELVVRWDTPE